MGKDSAISWTHHTFNPWWGCTKVHVGETPSACDHCYAERDSKRYGHDVWGSQSERRFFGDKHWSEPIKWNASAAVRGVRERVFCASMCDIFEQYNGPSQPQLSQTRSKLWGMIQALRGLDWLLLTKRPENVPLMVPGLWYENWPSHVWMGCTAEHQQALDVRWPHMQKIPARIKFISYESALGPITVPPDCNWFIAGGESGAKARPSHPNWFRSVQAQCEELGIPFHFKQWGEYNSQLVRVGKKSAGRLLDGVEYNGFPQ